MADTDALVFRRGECDSAGLRRLRHPNADLFVLLGNRISLYYGCGLLLRKNARIVQVDIEPEEIGRNHIVHLPVVSDIREFLRECNRLLEEQKTGPALTAQFSPVDCGIAGEGDCRDQFGPPGLRKQQSSDSPRPVSPGKSIFSWTGRKILSWETAGDTQVWMGMFRTVRKEGHYLESGLYGCLGVGIPYAIAAKLLYPEKRVLNIIGDGSVGFNFMEFETAIRKKIPIVVVISNDLGWGMIRHSSKLKLGRTIEEASEIGQIHYQKFVESMGGFGMLVEKPEEIRPAIEKAFASGKPACINVLTDPTAVGPGALALAMVSGYKMEGLKI